MEAQKKMIIKRCLLMVCMLGILSLGVACGNAAGNVGAIQSTEETESEIKIEIVDAEEILQNTWNEYQSGELFKIMGGHFSSAIIDKPAKYDLTQTTDLVLMYCVPESQLSIIDDAATMVDLFNTARFTVGAYHLTDVEGVQSMIDDTKKQIVENQWHGEKPEKIILLKVDEEYVLSIYGRESYVDKFKQKLESIYKKVIEVVVEEKVS